jgi:acetylornithine deacetylase
VSGPTAIERAALDAIDRDALLALTASLVAIPSLDAAGESQAQEHVAAALRGIGAEVDRWDIDLDTLRGHERYSAEVERAEAVGVVGTVGGGSGRHLLLDGHVDVVPVGDRTQWTDDPFAPRVRDGHLYGRGACDMKAGLAAAIHAVDAIVRSGIELDGSVSVTSVVGEEDGGCGTLATLLHGVTADACIIPEPTELALVPANAGALTFRITVTGLSAHGATRLEGVSAIEKLPLVLGALADLERSRNARARGPLFEWTDLPFAICPGRVVGGDWPSSVADRMVLEGRYGIAPGEDVAAAERELDAAMAALGSTDPWLAEHPPVVEWWGGRYLPGATALDDPIVATVAASAADVTGSAPAMRGMPYGCDLSLTTGVGGIPTVVFGPGSADRAHKPDERVPVDELVRSCEALVLAIMRFCGARSR